MRVGFFLFKGGGGGSKKDRVITILLSELLADNKNFVEYCFSKLFPN